MRFAVLSAATARDGLQEDASAIGASAPQLHVLALVNPSATSNTESRA